MFEQSFKNIDDILHKDAVMKYTKQVFQMDLQRSQKYILFTLDFASDIKNQDCLLPLLLKS